MTLNEKFEKATQGWIVADRCEEVADEFAIGFAEWLVIRYNEDIIFDEYTTKELLEIYKYEIL